MTTHIRPNRDPMNAGWLVFGTMLSNSFGRTRTAPPPQPDELHTARRKGLARRLLAWWFRPLPQETGKEPRSAADAATRLEILARGGFPR